MTLHLPPCGKFGGYSGDPQRALEGDIAAALNILHDERAHQLFAISDGAWYVYGTRFGVESF